MKIEIQDAKLKKIIQDEKKLEKSLNKDLLKIFMQRINEIEAFNNFKEILDFGLGKPHSISKKIKRCYGIRLTGNYRLVVEPLCEKLDNISLAKCQKVDLKGVVDYHGDKYNWIIP